MNLFGLLDHAATRFGPAGAVYRGADRFCTWAELRRRSLGIAQALRLQTRPGSRIAIASENRPEIVELLFGIWAAERIAVPLNYKLHPREMAQILEDSGAARLFASPKLAHELGAVSQGAVCVIGGPRYSALIAEEPAQAPVTDPATLAWLFYTSGTTGRSKGAMLSHRNLMAMSVAHLADVDAPDEHASLLHGAPMSHGSGLLIPPYVARGARQVVPASSSFEADEFLDLCEQHPACSAFLAPTMVQRLVESARPAPPNLRTIVYGGGPMYVESIKRAMRRFGRDRFAQIYGQGESPMTITALRRADHALDDDAILGSVGCARSGVQVAVLREDGSAAQVDEPGEIVCRGDVVMSGYWNNPEATAATLREGWLYTGDVGSFDTKGYLTLRDRSKDVVISGGSNIYPREVEEALLGHADVAEVCVVGAPDPEWGEVVVAFVVPSTADAPSTASLDAHCLDRIARFKRPKRYVFVEQLPKSSYGKVLKRELRLLLADTGNPKAL